MDGCAVFSTRADILVWDCFLISCDTYLICRVRDVTKTFVEHFIGDVVQVSAKKGVHVTKEMDKLAKK